jgi:hypothetical protein
MNTEVQRQVGLWIEINETGANTCPCQSGTKIGGCGRLSDATLLIDDRDHTTSFEHVPSVRQASLSMGQYLHRCRGSATLLAWPA